MGNSTLVKIACEFREVDIEVEVTLVHPIEKPTQLINIPKRVIFLGSIKHCKWLDAGWDCSRVTAEIQAGSRGKAIDKDQRREEVKIEREFSLRRKKESIGDRSNVQSRFCIKTCVPSHTLYLTCLISFSSSFVRFFFSREMKTFLPRFSLDVFILDIFSGFFFFSSMLRMRRLGACRGAVKEGQTASRERVTGKSSKKKSF